MQDPTQHHSLHHHNHHYYYRPARPFLWFVIGVLGTVMFYEHGGRQWLASLSSPSAGYSYSYSAEPPAIQQSGTSTPSDLGSYFGQVPTYEPYEPKESAPEDKTAPPKAPQKGENQAPVNPEPAKPPTPAPKTRSGPQIKPLPNAAPPNEERAKFASPRNTSATELACFLFDLRLQ